MVMVGDRGMIPQKAVDEMSQDAGVDWITALRSASIRTLVEQKHLQLGLFASATCWRSARLTIPVSACWRAATRSWPNCARTREWGCCWRLSKICKR